MSKPPSPSQAAQDNDPGNIPFPFRGVFSEISTKSVGFGATKRKEKIKRLWLLERDEEGVTSIRSLNSDYLPTGEAKTVELDKIMNGFYPEPGIYMNKVAPKLYEAEKHTDEGDEHRGNEEHYSAEYSYKSALAIDEDHIRANFGLGLTYLAMGDSKRAQHTFQKIVSLDSAFDPDHKHLFNDFGISLRKSGMFEECFSYYNRALELHPEDDHLLFNIARAHFDAEDYPAAMEASSKALDVNPDQKQALRLREAILAKDPSLGDS